jgi:hypothetical protein
MLLPVALVAKLLPLQPYPGTRIWFPFGRFDIVKHIGYGTHCTGTRKCTRQHRKQGTVADSEPQILSALYKYSGLRRQTLEIYRVIGSPSL